MVNIRSRANWDARASRGVSQTTWAARRGFTVHYSAGPTSQTPRQIQNFHMNPPPSGRGWSDVAYNFLVDRNGVAYEGRGWLGVGAHAAPHNTSHIGVCFIGRDGDATPAAKATIRALYDEAVRRKGGNLTMTHHGGLSGNSTSCPGADLRSWVQSGMPASGTGGAPDGLGTSHMLGLKRGDKGQAVRDLQVFLRDAGYPPANSLHGGEWDGDYGAGTSAAVLACRRANGGNPANGDTVSYWAMNQLRRGWFKQMVKEHG